MVLASAASVRVLVVDDFEPFRQIISAMVRERTGLRLVGQAADGLEAVRQAEILAPDLILLDIALPGMNGIEAARRIHKAAPACKIIFLSQNSSPGLAEEAFRVGAHGYVLKTDAAAEFFPAIDAVLAGKKYVSNGLGGQIFPATA